MIFTADSRRGQVVELDRARLTIGRIADNDLQLADEKVSRHHAVIERQQGGTLLLRDLGSRNGTFVDGVRLPGARVLSGGERLRFGDQELRVEGGRWARPPTEATATSVPRAPAEAASPLTDAHTRRRARGGRRARYLAVGVALAVIAVVFGIGQLVLPGLAEQHLRSQLSRYGTVRQLQIESAPAIKLLWHRADRVKVVMDSYRSEPGGHGSLADFLSRTRGTGSLDVRVGTLQTQRVTLHDVRLQKQGDTLVGQARLSQAELSAALPAFVNLRPVSASQNGIVLQVGASLLGHQVATKIGVRADSGRVIVRPESLPFGSLATITVFDDPRVYVESLGAELHGDQYLLTARARLR